MKVDYYNRYGDTIVFEKLDDNTIKMSGYQYSRSGFNEDGSKIQFIDPSGGPYIGVGMNLNTYFNTKKDMIIKAIEFEPGNGTVLKI
jgi:hypothetical protein